MNWIILIQKNEELITTKIGSTFLLKRDLLAGQDPDGEPWVKVKEDMQEMNITKELAEDITDLNVAKWHLRCLIWSL